FSSNPHNLKQSKRVRLSHRLKPNGFPNGKANGIPNGNPNGLILLPQRPRLLQQRFRSGVKPLAIALRSLKPKLLISNASNTKPQWKGVRSACPTLPAKLLTPISNNRRNNHPAKTERFSERKSERFCCSHPSSIPPFSESDLLHSMWTIARSRSSPSQ